MKETDKVTETDKRERVLIKKCHVCGQMMESHSEIKKCVRCKKSFLPSHYFAKIHAKNSKEYLHLFAESDELREEDLIKGINVLW